MLAQQRQVAAGRRVPDDGAAHGGGQAEGGVRRPAARLGSRMPARAALWAWGRTSRAPPRLRLGLSSQQAAGLGGEALAAHHLGVVGRRAQREGELAAGGEEAAARRASILSNSRVVRVFSSMALQL